MTSKKLNVIAICVSCGIASVGSTYFLWPHIEERRAITKHFGDPYPASIRAVTIDDTNRGWLLKSYKTLTFEISRQELDQILARQGYVDVTTEFERSKNQLGKKSRSDMGYHYRFTQDQGITVNQAHERRRDVDGDGHIDNVQTILSHSEAEQVYYCFWSHRADQP